MDDYSWDAEAFFRKLTESSKLAAEMGAKFCAVSGPQGFEDVLSSMKSTKAFVAVCSEEDGAIDIDNTPHSQFVYIIFLAERYKVDKMDARKNALKRLRRLFAQFASVLIQEKIRLEQDAIYIDSKIRFKEIDKYFFSGAACAFFQVSVTHYSDISFNEDKWTTPLI